jgi:hypothetical protein
MTEYTETLNVELLQIEELEAKIAPDDCDFIVGL